jgi:hypothetical protein
VVITASASIGSVPGPALTAGEPVETVPGGAGLSLPVRSQDRGDDRVILARPARGDRPPLQHVERPGAGLGAVVLVGPAGDQLGKLGLDLPGPLREHLRQRLRDADQIRLPGAVGHGLPIQAEPAGQLRAQRRVVHPGQRLLLLLQPPGIQGQPHAGAVLDLGRDDRMGVQPRVRRAAGVLAEDPDGEATGVDLVESPGAAASDQAVALNPCQRGVDRGVLGGGDLGADLELSPMSRRAHAAVS